MTVTDFERLLAVLTNGKVEFVVVGGFAATAHGSAHVTAECRFVDLPTPAGTNALNDTLEWIRPSVHPRATWELDASRCGI